MTAPHKSHATKKPKKRKVSPEAQARAKARKAAARAKEKEANAARKAKIQLKAKKIRAKKKAKEDARKATEKAQAAKHAHAKATTEAWHESQALRAKFTQSPTIQNERAKNVAIEKHRLMLKENMPHGAAHQKARGTYKLSDMREAIAQHEDSKEFEKLLAAAREIDKKLPGQDRADKAHELIKTKTLRGTNNEIMRNVVLGSPKGSYVDEVKQRYKGAGHHHRHHGRGHGHHHRHHGHGHHSHGHHGHGDHH